VGLGTELFFGKPTLCRARPFFPLCAHSKERNSSVRYAENTEKSDDERQRFRRLELRHGMDPACVVCVPEWGGGGCSPYQACRLRFYFQEQIVRPDSANRNFARKVMSIGDSRLCLNVYPQSEGRACSPSTASYLPIRDAPYRRASTRLSRIHPRFWRNKIPVERPIS